MVLFYFFDILNVCNYVRSLAGFYSNLVAIVANGTVSILSKTEEHPDIIPEILENVVNNPSTVADLTKKVPRKELNESSSTVDLE